jgi:hypothetical protein
MAIAIVFLILGLCRELDIQSTITDYWRTVARYQGWYGDRRSFQPVMIIAIGVGSMVGAIVLMRSLPGLSPFAQLASVGTFILMAYIAVRAVSFHHVDVLARQTFLGLRLSWFMEFAGILVVIVAALRRRARLADKIVRISARSSGDWDRVGENFKARRPPATRWPAIFELEEPPHGPGYDPEDPTPRRPRQPPRRRALGPGFSRRGRTRT